MIELNEREQLQETVERDQQALHEAVEDLKVAVNRPFRLVERIKENPLPWVISAVLIGFCLGANGHESDQR